MKRFDFSRRQAVAAFGSLLAGARRAQPQELIGEPPGRVPPPSELVNAFEFERMASRKLDSALYAEIAVDVARRCHYSSAVMSNRRRALRFCIIIFV